MFQGRSRWWMLVVGMGVMFAAAQAVPHGHSRANPPIVREPSWDSPLTRELAKRDRRS